MNQYEQFIFKSRYARWNEDEQRRENWDETVKRYCDFFHAKFPDTFPYNDIYSAILERKVMPSMRCLMTAGEALDRDNVAGYNCSYLPIDHPRAFDETMYLLMCGTGVGFSVERQHIAKLPTIAEEFHDTSTTIVVADSRIGWASSFRELISLLYSGRIPKWDLSRVRPAGARLKTFGGRASGPEPLDELFNFTVGVFRRAAGRKLNSLECHDLVCKVAEAIIVGGVRRSALISLSNLTDERMRNAKNGAWWEQHSERTLANNSVAYTEKPDLGIFLKEWHTLYESKSGERGLFNRVAARKQAGSNGRRDTDEAWEYGTNPCGEIILRPNGLCNLSEVVVRPEDTYESLREKVRIATIIGTFQATLTDFRYLRPSWKRTAEEERLLGVSLTGIMDCRILSIPNHQGFLLKNTLTDLRQNAIETNKEWASKLGIQPSAAITCVKPSGTVSQLVGCSSGIHPSYSEFYIRTVRNDKKDPISQFLIDSGVPYELDAHNPDSVYVFSFPVQAPKGSVTKDSVSALEQLELYDIYKRYWCEHNPSITVYYRDDEFLGIGDWVYRNWDDFIGISLLPYSDHVYKQAPYQPITEDQYRELGAKMPSLLWERLREYESSDQTTASHELACVAGVCEI